ncbi:MAG: hypothetical protein IPI49_30500 [Myxococcales bacterium]|nr:hypothetical protein [Myxococcales bacterium]
MTRMVWPHAFTLAASALREAFETGRAAKAVREFFPADDQKDHDGVPNALRWCVAPWLGMPRMPFEVYRRPRRGFRAKPLLEPVKINAPVGSAAPVAVEWNHVEMYLVACTADPAPGRVLVIEPVDRRGEPMPGRRVTVSTAQSVLFRAAGIASLRVSGEGELSNVQGVEQTGYANLADWQRVEVVGLPVEKGLLAGAYDDAAPQGPEAASLPGFEAARRRLQLAAYLQLPPPPTGVADLPTPTLPRPDAVRYLKALFEPQPGIMTLIAKCLQNTDDNDPAHLQRDFRYDATIDGLRQADLAAGTAGTGDPAQAALPVVGITMLTVTGDSFAATGLGYGTVDFPPRQRDVPATHARATDPGLWGFDYMVTARFTLPWIGTLEVAALSSDALAPEPAVALAAARRYLNRNPARDTEETESVALTWRLSAAPQGWLVATSHKPDEVKVCNAERRGGAGGYDPFVPLRPAAANGDLPPGATTSFVDPVSPVPMAGVSTTRYLVAGLDVFGVWSPWRIAAHSAPAKTVQLPQLGAAAVELDKAAAMGKVVPGALTFDLAWDWSDRSPDQVEIHGHFFAPSAGPGAPFLGGFARGGTGPTDALVVRFVGDTATIDASVPGSVGSDSSLEVLAAAPPDPGSPPAPPGQDADLRKLRITVRNLRCDFSSASELAFAICARATERVRPAEWSGVVGPRPARMFDPLPPAVPSLPIDLQWTALPDSTGRARGVLRWPRSSGARGYVIWECAETALRHAINPAAPEPAPTDSLLTRAASLRAALAAPGADERSLGAFARLHTELIPDVPTRPTQELELELPASAATLFAFRVSAVSASNEESERSASVALFAVPKIMRPTQPSLALRPVADGASRGIKLLALAGPGPSPAGFRVHRVRRADLVDDVGLMGPQILAHDATGWHNDELPTLRGPAQPCRSIVDAVTPSWATLFYKIVAIGSENRAAGELRGESLASATQSIVIPPEGDPSLAIAGTSSGSNNCVLSFATNLPVAPCPLGRATIEVFAVVVSGAGKARARGQRRDVVRRGRRGRATGGRPATAAQLALCPSGGAAPRRRMAPPA